MENNQEKKKKYYPISFQTEMQMVEEWTVFVLKTKKRTFNYVALCVCIFKMSKKLFRGAVHK